MPKNYLNRANLVCGGLLVILFVYMCISSYVEYRQTKEIPFRIKTLEEKVDQISRKLNEPLDYPIVEIPHPSREMAEIPIIQEFDRYFAITACIIWVKDD